MHVSFTLLFFSIPFSHHHLNKNPNPNYGQYSSLFPLTINNTYPLLFIFSQSSYANNQELIFFYQENILSKLVYTHKYHFIKIDFYSNQEE